MLCKNTERIQREKSNSLEKHHWLLGLRNKTGSSGIPVVSTTGRMTSSGRTVMTFPPNAMPFMLKFSGDFFAPELGFNDVLNQKNLRQAIANYNQQKSNPYLTPEPCGIAIPKQNFAFLQRALPLLKNDSVRSDDVLLSAAVILSSIQIYFSLFYGFYTHFLLM